MYKIRPSLEFSEKWTSSGSVSMVVHASVMPFSRWIGAFQEKILPSTPPFGFSCWIGPSKEIFHISQCGKVSDWTNPKSSALYLCSLWDYIVTFAKLLSFAGKSCDSNADSACQLQGLKSQIRPWFFSLLAKWERRRESRDKNSLAGKSRPGGGFMSRIHLAKVGVMKTNSDFVNLQNFSREFKTIEGMPTYMYLLTWQHPLVFEL